MNINRTVKRRDYAETTRLWVRCTSCGCRWQWNGHTENVDSALETISTSACMCNWPRVAKAASR